jgi:hypothetical protein
MPASSSDSTSQIPVDADRIAGFGRVKLNTRSAGADMEDMWFVGVILACLGVPFLGTTGVK